MQVACIAAQLLDFRSFHAPLRGASGFAGSSSAEYGLGPSRFNPSRKR